MSISLIAVFIPILMMPGIIGRLFREFAVVLSVAIAVSLAVSLTTTPMMCSRLLKVKHTHGRLYNWTENIFQWVISTYAAALDAVLRFPSPMLVVMAISIAVSGYLYVKIPKGFFPQQDTGRLFGFIQGQQHISYQSLVEKAKFFEPWSGPTRMSIPWASLPEPAVAARAEIPRRFRPAERQTHGDA